MKTVLITGASRGIGLAATKRFLKEGWRVIGTYNTTKPPITEKAFQAVQLDLAQPPSITEAAVAVTKLTDQLDVLVNNAAIILDAASPALDVEIMRQTFEVDVFGTADFTNQILPLLKSGSHIINVDSLYGAQSFPIDEDSSAAYRMAKAALNMYTRVLAYKLKDKNITVSALDPGWVSTDMGNAVATEDDGPDRQPEEAGNDIYNLAISNCETGHFWKYGAIREW